MSFAFINGNGVDEAARERLIAGYVHIHFESIHVPAEIINLIADYSKDWILWKISREQFATFQRKAEQSSTANEWHCHNLAGPTFSVHGFQFACNLASVSHAEFLQFQTRLLSINKSIHSNIRCIVVYYEVCCFETNSSEKDSKVLHEIGDQMAWPMYNMRVAECAHLNSFTFNICVDIFKIEFKQHPMYTHHPMKQPHSRRTFESLSVSMQRDVHYRPIKMHSKINYSWQIGNSLLSQFKQSAFGKYWYSENFGLDGTEINGKNFAWCLYIVPHGYNHSMNHRVYVGIVLLNLPAKIKKVEINFVMQCEVQGTQQAIEYKQSGKILHYRDNCVAWPGNDDLTIQHLRKLKESETDKALLVVRAQIEIARVFNDSGMEINRSDWEYFGVAKPSMLGKTDIAKSFSWLQYLYQR